MNLQEVRLLRKQCRFHEAEQQARAILANTIDPAERADALCQLAFVLSCQDKLTEAEELNQQALELTQDKSLERIRGHALRLQCVLLWLKGEYSKAMDSCLKARKIAEECGDMELLYQTGISIGSAQVYEGEHALGIEALLACSKVAESCEDWQQAAVAHTNLGVAYCAIGNTQLGIHHHRQAQNIYQRYPSPTHMALCLMNIALACSEEEDYDEALTFDAGALEFLPPGKKPLAEAAIRLNMGQCLYWLDRLESAKRQLERAIELFEAAGHLAGATEGMPYLGCCLVRSGSIPRGLETCGKALKLSEQVGRKDIKLEVRMMTGHAFYHAGDLQSAREHLEAVHAAVQGTQLHRIQKQTERMLKLTTESRGH